MAVGSGGRPAPRPSAAAAVEREAIGRGRARMTLLLSNEEVQVLLPTTECLDVLEQAYRALAAGRAPRGECPYH